VKKLKKVFLITILFYFSNISFSQIKIPSGYAEFSIKTGIGVHSPFWMVSNKFGTESIKNNSIAIRSAIVTDLDKNKHFDYSYGLDLLGWYDKNGKAFLHQAYIQGKIYFLRFLAGKKEEIFGEQDSTLSSGGLLWSGNAPPMPKVAIYVDYTPIPFTRGYFEFKGGLSHGWFGSNQYVKDYYLHHKFVYLRFGGDLPVHLHFGFHHFAQWGGTSLNPNVGKLPGDLKAFWKIFWARSADSSEHAPGGEILNRLGNHIGYRDAGADLELNNYSIGLYWQTMFEDVFGSHWANIKDGLWGISVKTKNKRRLVNGFVYEFIHTTDQSVKRNQKDSIIRGNDDYFYHYIYKPGWVYNEYVIGTPLISSPILNNNSLIYNNLVIAHHIGLSGFLSSMNYKILITYVRNYGRNSDPFKNVKKNLSTLIRLKMPVNLLGESKLGLELANDFGNMYHNNIGILITFQKDF